MNRPSQPPDANELIQSALEASCDALIALQLVEASLVGTADDVEPARERNRRAIEEVRLEIEELRGSLGGDHSAFAMGFVLRPEQTTRALGKTAPRRQSRPRRTA